MINVENRHLLTTHRSIKNSFNVDFAKHNNCCSYIRSMLNVFLSKDDAQGGVMRHLIVS